MILKKIIIQNQFKIRRKMLSFHMTSNR